MFCKNCGQQLKIGSKFCKNCGQELKIGRFVIFREKTLCFLKDNSKTIFIIFGMILFSIIIILYNEYFISTSPPQDFYNNQPISYDQQEITASVVNIFCPSTLPEKEVSGGSGTILSEDGIILTNSHIIPQDEDNVYVGEEGCLVILPDPITGQPSEAYLARPIVIPGLSDDYDLAFMEIYSAFYDEEKGEYAGSYPRLFPAFDDTTQCKNENVQLGEPIRVFGYPAISGGYSLTITDGVVSSFPGEGFIITSAKISYGNSGGLSIDRYGCMIGVPSMVSTDEHESLGVIISMDLVNEFIDELSKINDDFRY